MTEWKYILAEDGKTPIIEPDVIKWARWFEKSNRRVAFDQIGSTEISTVFLGIDHRFHSGGPPILWETMIFHSNFEELQHYQERYTSWEDAVKGHHRAVLLVMEKQPKQ
jgi:hypothetical protein